MPDQICTVNDSTCENCRRGMPRPHQYKKWVAQTGWCLKHEEKQEEKGGEDISIPEENLPF